MPRWPRAVLFDFDGVLVNSEPLHFYAFHEVLKTEKTTDGKVLVRVRATVDRAVVVARLVEAKVPVPGVADKDDTAAQPLLMFTDQQKVAAAQ